jgi:hypothetical protein
MTENALRDIKRRQISLTFKSKTNGEKTIKRCEKYAERGFAMPTEEELSELEKYKGTGAY